MRKVFLSFLGLGQYDKEQQKYVYRKTVYEFNEKISSPTKFVQVAEQELLGWDYFDILYIVATKKSIKAHYDFLQKQLSRCRGDIELIHLDGDMSGFGQWIWFEKIFRKIKERDKLCVDLTHGYRSIPIVFSAAINFLQKTKSVQVTNVFYGAYEHDKERAPLVDMNSFFDINIWADAVTRLTDDADAGGIAKAALTTNKHQFSELADDKFVTACSEVTQKIKSVDVNNVSDEVNVLLNQMESMKEKCSPEAEILLDLVRDKFTSIADTSNPDKTGYSLQYFQIQLELARLLLEHDLFMQAFTVMREWLSSLVMLYFEKQSRMNAGKRRKRLVRYGGVFFNMLQYNQEKWEFKDKNTRQRVEPFFDDLREAGVLATLLKEPLVAKEISDYRNGFDHAWLGIAGMKNDIEKKGEEFLQILKGTLQLLKAYLK